MMTPFSVNPGGTVKGFMGRAAAFAAPLMDPLLGLHTLDRLYAELPDGNFIDRALERLDITVGLDDEHLRRVPATGPVVIVANHPTGALDGLALAHALLRRRSDVRLLGNHLLARIPEMRDWTIAVNPFDCRSATTHHGLRAARTWLGNGGLLVVFPAGEVSHIRTGDGTLVDPPWQHGALRLARWTGAAIVPAFIDARSSRWFRWAGSIHPRLRTALLPRELLRLRRQTVNVRIGTPVTPARLREFQTAPRQLAYLRARTYALEPAPLMRQPTAAAPIAPAQDSGALRREIRALTPAHELFRSGEYSVFCATADLMPALLREIGRLREATFRAVGEGTHRDIDLDRFDRTYQHLFVWHHGRGEIAGAYRVGATDRVAAHGRVDGLYTHTLFHLRRGFLDAAGPALELGRSFVRAEYQRESNALLMLWKGIGALVARDPKYRRLFGPVSISADYSRLSLDVMVRSLERLRGAPRWRGVVRSRRARRPSGRAAVEFVDSTATLDQINELVRDFEHGTPVPVLVRQYWKLGAEVLGFSVDPAFGGSVDGLMMVDLARLPDAVLQRYLGADGTARFRCYHARG